MNQTRNRSRIAMLLAGLLSAALITGASAAEYAANPYVDGEARYVAGELGLARWNASQTTPVWQTLGKVPLFEPVTAGNNVLVGSRQGLYAVSKATGEILWQHAAGVHLYSPTVEDGVAYVGGADGSLRALDVHDGAIIWLVRMQGWIYPPVVRDGLVVTGGQAGVIHAVSAATGEQRWQRNLVQELVYRAVEIDPERLIVTTFDARATVLRLHDGSIDWQRDTGSAMISAKVNGEVVELLGFSNQPLVLRLSDGTQM